MRKVSQCFGTTEAEFDKPIKDALPEVHNKTIHLIRETIKLQHETELERTIIKKGEDMVRLIVSVDGSDVGHSCVVHFVMKDKAGNLRSRIVRAKNKINVSTTPSNELNAYYLGLEVLNQILMSLVDTMSTFDFQNFDIVFVNDSLSTNLQLLGFSHKANTKRLAEKIRRELSLLKQGLKHKMGYGKPIIFAWLSSEHVPADINSKEPKTFKQTELWKEGPEMYKNEHLLDFVWAYFEEQNFVKEEKFKGLPNAPVNLDVRQVTLYLVNLDDCQEIEDDSFDLERNT